MHHACVLRACAGEHFLGLVEDSQAGPFLRAETGVATITDGAVGYDHSGLKETF